VVSVRVVCVAKKFVKRHLRVIPLTYGPRRRNATLTILSALLAVLADAVMSSVASTRRTYLVEFGRYLESQGLDRPPAPRRPSA